MLEKVYIVEVDTLEQLEVQYMPNELTDSSNAELNAIKTIARNQPFQGYSGVENTITFSLDFYSQQNDRKDVLQKTRWLKSMTFGESFNGKPSRLRIVWGEFLNDFTFVLDSVNIKYSNMMKYHEGLPCQAMVDLTFKLDMDKNVLRSDIRK